MIKTKWVLALSLCGLAVASPSQAELLEAPYTSVVEGLATSTLCPALELLCMPMMKTSSNVPSGYQGILLLRRDDDGLVMGVDYKDNYDGHDVTPGWFYHHDFDLERLRAGGVLIQALGMDMLSIAAPDFDASAGGIIRVDVKPGALAAKRPVYFSYKNQTMELRLQTEEGPKEFSLMRVEVSRVAGVPTSVKLVDFLLAGRTIHTIKF